MKKRVGLQGVLTFWRKKIGWIFPMGVIGTDNMVETYNYEKSFYRAVHSVGRVWIPGEKDIFGTGFMVGPDLFLTNQHVLRDQAAVEKSIIWLEYDEPTDITGQSYHEARGVKLLRSSPQSNLDYALIRVEFVETGNMGWKPVYVNLRDFGSKPQPDKDSVIIVQHPDGGARRIVTKDTLVVEVVGDYIRYLADTDEGSSGAPVFDLDYRIIGLHHAAYSSRNEAISIEEVVMNIKDLIPE